MRIHTEIRGTIGGHIWMPAIRCTKPFHVKRDQYPFRPSDNIQGERSSLRDIILHVTNDGDFQDAQVLEASIILTAYRQSPRGDTIIVKRVLDIRDFPSVSDCVMGA
jgi:hypothetical protein